MININKESNTKKRKLKRSFFLATLGSVLYFIFFYFYEGKDFNFKDSILSGLVSIIYVGFAYYYITKDK